MDEIYEQGAAPPEKRLPLLEENREVVAQRDDSLTARSILKVATGKYDQAIEILSSRKFAVAEGSNLNVVDQWMNAYLLRGRKNIDARRYKEALADFQTAVQVPANIPTENVTLGGRSAEIAYLTGVAYEGMGDKQSAMQSYTKGSAPPESAPFRRPGMGADAMPGSPEPYYQALCLQKLGQPDQAKAIFQGLVDSGLKAVQQQTAGSPLAAPSAGRRAPSPRARLASAHYLSGLGYLGLNDQQKAKQALTQALQASPDLLGARTALRRSGSGLASQFGFSEPLRNTGLSSQIRRLKKTASARPPNWQLVPVFDYAAYEVTAMRRLMGRYGTCEEEVDELLRQVGVCGSVRCRPPFHADRGASVLAEERREAVSGESVRARSPPPATRWFSSRRWPIDQDGADWTTSATLQEKIRDYNQEHCEST